MESFCICVYAVSFQAHFIHSGAGVSILSSQQDSSGFELPGQLGRGGCGVCCSPCAFFGGGGSSHSPEACMLGSLVLLNIQ